MAWHDMTANPQREGNADALRSVHGVKERSRLVAVTCRAGQVYVSIRCMVELLSEAKLCADAACKEFQGRLKPAGAICRIH